jgi:D-alanyl-D-alanine endopeptidase (penicillin-binding protein 7)
MMKKWSLCVLVVVVVVLLLPFGGAGARQLAGAQQSTAAPQSASVRNARNFGNPRIDRRNSSRAENSLEERLALGSASVLVLDQITGVPLLEKQANAVVPIASISKLMTAMVVLDAGQDMEEVISITTEDTSGTRSRLPVGVRMTRDTALLLALMSSENRAANALGRNYPGGWNPLSPP